MLTGVSNPALLQAKSCSSHSWSTRGPLRYDCSVVKPPPFKGFRSGIVTGLAYTFLILSGLGMIFCVLWFVIFTFVPPGNVRASPVLQPLPEIYKTFLDSPRPILIVFFVIALFQFISAAGLLRRKNWGRLLFVALMGLGILWSLYLMSHPGLFEQSFPKAFGLQFSHELERSFRTLNHVFRIIMFIVWIAFLGWIIQKLLSSSVRREFS